MKKVVFLDRDGVINREIGDYVYCLEDFEINDGVEQALLEWSRLGYAFVIVTNQGGISKKRYFKKQVDIINKHLVKWFEQREFSLLGIAYCPHHDFIEACICRKPNSLMLEKLIAKNNISIEQSFMIGDSLRDVQAANKIGMKAYQIKANSDLNELIKKL